jgi:hypothetical protein
MQWTRKLSLRRKITLATAAAALHLEKDAKNNDAESAKISLVEVERAVKHLLPALAELCQAVTK